MARKKGGKTLLCLLIAAFFLYLILGGSIEGAGKDGGAKDGGDGSWVNQYMKRYPAQCGKCKAAWRRYKTKKKEIMKKFNKKIKEAKNTARKETLRANRKKQLDSRSQSRLGKCEACRTASKHFNKKKKKEPFYY